MTPSRSDKAQAGFTLLEAVLAMSLLATIMVLLSMITGQWLPNWNRGFARVQASELLASGLERLVSDLSAAQFVTLSRETPQPLFEGARRSVTFVREVLEPAALPGLEIVRIAETPGPSGGLVVARMRAPFMPIESRMNRREEPAFADPVVLLRPPYRLALFYAGRDRIWHETWRKEIALPSAIKMTVSDAASGRTLAVSTAALVHAEMPAECITAKSLADCVKSRAQAGEDAKPRPVSRGGTQ
jgi:general secretion pathway protein J